MSESKELVPFAGAPKAKSAPGLSAVEAAAAEREKALAKLPSFPSASSVSDDYAKQVLADDAETLERELEIGRKIVRDALGKVPGMSGADDTPEGGSCHPSDDDAAGPDADKIKKILAEDDEALQRELQTTRDILATVAVEMENMKLGMERKRREMEEEIARAFQRPVSRITN